MAQSTWELPLDASDALTTSRSEINNAAENLRTNHSGSTDPAGGGGAGSVNYMFWVDTTSTDTLKGRDSADSAWLTLGLWAANLGMVRHDGSQAMTGNLDLDGNDLILDSDGDSFLHASADDQIDLVIGPSAAQTYRFTATTVDLNGSTLILDADGDSSIDAATDNLVTITSGGNAIAYWNLTGMKLGTVNNHGTTGGTNVLTFLEGTAPEGTLTNGGSLYVADVGGITELFFLRSNNTSIQLS